MFKLPARKLFYLALFIPIIALPLIAQQDAVRSAISSAQRTSYPLPGSLFLQKQEQAIHAYIRLHPEAIQRSNALHKATTWGFTVGSTHSWYADNLVTNTRYAVPSTCRAVGDNCYIFVEDANWTDGKSGRVTQAIVDSVRLAFDSRTPANGSLGIFQMDTAAFGTPPDVDNDPRIIILLLDIKDGYSGSGGYIAGYFFGYNEMPISTQYPTSNHAEIYFLDVNPADLTTTTGLTDGLSTTAHEFQHMIHFNYTNILNNNISRMAFINEGCSVLAEVNAGYAIYDQSGYDNETNHYLFDWRDNKDTVLKDYSRAARFFTYIRDQVGIGVFKDIVNSKYDGVDNLNDALTRFGSSMRFADILQNWFIANTLNDRTVDPKYGYLYPNLPSVNELNYYNPNVSLTTDTIKNYAARYLDYKDGAQLAATFTETNPALIVKAVETGPTSKRVVSVPNGTVFSEPLYGSTYTDIHFIVMNTDPSNAYTYTYSSSGISQEVELKHDASEPVGVLPLAAGDTVCVAFDAVQGGKLDSVRVALRRSSTIRAGIWAYTGTSNPTPLGQPLAINLTTAGTSTVTGAYPVPWANWGTIDLRSKNISTNSPFAVGFIMDGAYSGTTYNYVMVTTGPVGNGATSFTYSSQAESGAQWYVYYPSTADTIYYYIVRAYVSFNSSDGNDTTKLTPLSFSLNQNFPNPFNPTTTIQYQLPVQGFVTLKVYDILGRDVATLVNQPMSDGPHTATFNGSRFSSGVYFYRITTNNFTETKKMLLLK